MQETKVERDRLMQGIDVVLCEGTGAAHRAGEYRAAEVAVPSRQCRRGEQGWSGEERGMSPPSERDPAPAGALPAGDEPPADADRAGATSTRTLSVSVVSADLLRGGWEVYSALGPPCTCDLIAVRDGRMRRIIVRSATVNPTDRLSANLRGPRAGRFDTLALVVRGVEVVYAPELSTGDLTPAVAARLTPGLAEQVRRLLRGTP